MEKQSEPSIAILKGDKCLKEPEIRCLCVGLVETRCGQHEDKRVYVYKEEVFFVPDDDGEGIFFVPVIPVEGRKHERAIVPLYMLRCQNHLRQEIIRHGELQGLKINPRHFAKPQIALSYDQQLDINPDSLEPEEG